RFGFATRLILAVTLVVLAGVAAMESVRRLNFYGTLQQPQIGWLSNVHGDVQVKSGDGEFRRVGTGATLADGDQIVTGQDSKASINFHSGRTAESLSNSRITISSLEDAANSPTILIDATRAGQTEVANAAGDSRPLILLTGVGAITVSAGESAKAETSAKTGAAKVEKKDIKTGQTTTFTKIDSTQTTQIIQKAQAAVIAAPSPTPAPKPRLEASAELLAPSAGSVFWSTSEWRAIAATEIPLAVTVKSNTAMLRAVLELRQGPGNSPVRVPLTASAQPNSFISKTTVNDLVSASSEKIASGADIRKFSIAVVAGDGETAKRIPLNGDFSIASLAPLSQASSVVIGMDSLTGDPSAGPWVRGVISQEPEKLPIVITTVIPGLARTLIPALRTAKRAGFHTPASIGAAGTFAVKGQEIIAQIAGRALDNKLSDKLREVLDADFVFTGQQDALISAKKYSVEDIQKLVAKSTQSGKGVYVFQNDSLFQLNADFVRRYPSVASFVRRNSSAFFTQPVKINSFR
ncbi:hypothetical protein EBZ80_23765, partial [bacterium]|nr:hypothetical protein [bacterium]